MPKILQNTEQMNALTSVTNDLAAIEVINKMLQVAEDADTDTEFTVSTLLPDGGSKRKATCSVKISPKLSSRIQQVLVVQRSTMVKNILALTAKYSIELSDEEKQTIA